MIKFTSKIDGTEYPLCLHNEPGVGWQVSLEETGAVFAVVYIPSTATDEPSIVGHANVQLDKLKATYTFGRLSRHLDYSLFRFRKGGK